MKASARIIIAIAALSGLSPMADETPAPAPAAVSTIFVANGTTAERAMADWAVDRFRLAGLELPALTINFHDTIADCRGYLGIYLSREYEIRICNRDDEDTEPRHTLLHELAHAWSFTSLSGEEIENFNAHRDLNHWVDQEAAWWLQGSEQTAEVIAWGIQDPAGPFWSKWVHTESCDELAAAFRLLTGIDPLNDSEQFCK